MSDRTREFPLSDYLFAQPSFLTGMGRVVDIGGTFDTYNYKPTPEEADAIALYTDFRSVGAELVNAAAQLQGQ